MVILNIVHWSFSGVLLPLLFDAVNGDGFLQNHISAVSLVGEHIHDHALAKADGFAGDIIACLSNNSYRRESCRVGYKMQ